MQPVEVCIKTEGESLAALDNLLLRIGTRRGGARRIEALGVAALHVTKLSRINSEPVRIARDSAASYFRLPSRYYKGPDTKVASAPPRVPKVALPEYLK
jgi:hypothetical protein